MSYAPKYLENVDYEAPITLGDISDTWLMTLNQIDWAGTLAHYLRQAISEPRDPNVSSLLGMLNYWLASVENDLDVAFEKLCLKSKTGSPLAEGEEDSGAPPEPLARCLNDVGSQSPRAIAEAIACEAAPLAPNDDTPLTLPRFKLVRLIEQGIVAAQGGRS
ncbi:hypothetical protein [Methylococcus sp. EFPC2]|uniref:hypothetical protein n=1 Tax=Methylococcus sp. EFPC2 TaxID=2812648 RepID=UPI0019673107|nr:hypothetical protein [Methylococcus sp. EFPC2]QSA97127.1 hypothetical protein JWZ97_18365 [Methylococcus sp. EFPC2]